MFIEKINKRYIKHIIFLLLISFIFSQECGNNQCDETETYINCIDDCSITTQTLVWADNIPVHLDSEKVTVSINSVYLENLSAIEFEIEYDENVLELDITNCYCDNSQCITTDCEINNSTTLAYLVNTANDGVIEGIIYSGMFFAIDDGEFINITFNVIGSLGDYSNIIINQFKINDIDIIDYTENGLVTIGNFGCMDQEACNYSSEATFDNETCAYEYDCLGECGGFAVEDCLGDCNGDSIEDCLGDCNGVAVIDECGQCNGEMFINEYGFYPGDICDCDGTEPFQYCVDSDGDGFGNPSSEFFSCSEYNQETLVLDCTDPDDECVGNIDDCFICNGENIDKDCSGECFGSAIEDCAGDCNGNTITDECGECNGEMFLNNNAVYPNELCDCEGLISAINYCLDSDGDGAANYTELSCIDPPLGYVDCELLSIESEILKEYELISIYPNPFNPSVTINYTINKMDFITISVLDLNGRYIANLTSKIHIPGQHSIVWQPSIDISSGTYLLKFKYDSQIFIKKINYIK